MGFWTGRSTEAAADGRYAGIGTTTDIQGLLGEIELLCRREPSEILFGAVNRTYVRMRNAGR